MKSLILSENTKITLGLTIAVTCGIGFVTKTFFLADSNAAAITELQSRQDKFGQELSEVAADTRFMKQLMMEDRENRHGYHRNR